VHLTVPPSFRARDSQRRAPPRHTRTRRHSSPRRFSVTTPLRALIDVAAIGVDEDQLGRAIQEASDSGQITLRKLRERAETVDARAALRIDAPSDRCLMTYADAAALRMALEQRLRNDAAARGVRIDRLRRQVAFERVMIRLDLAQPGAGCSRGGWLWKLASAALRRTTRDLDLGLRSPSIDGPTLRDESDRRTQH